ncbi:NACHT domain-containing protein [Streptomyces poriticola]|uniref:hypothetical protein n=1 Tax=Streptomyces poriticola TaxID=3120506 RepID=UPI002FCE1E5D
MTAWWSRLGLRRRKGSSGGVQHASAAPGAVAASGDGALAIGGSVGVAVAGHDNIVTVWQSGSDEQVTLDDLAAAGRARMMQRWRAAGVPVALAAELADTSQTGALPAAAVAPSPGTCVVVLEGGFGSGKSLAAERQHQQDIAAARADAEAPIPVHLAAQNVQGDLIDAATRAARRLGDPAARGVALVVDGLDEPGPIRGKELLDQALSWTAASGARWRILATTRPGLEMDSKLRRSMPELAEGEAATLMERLGGNGLAVGSESDMVRSVLRRPLFAIIGAQIQQDRERLPSSPMAFLDALVTRALRDVESVKEERAERLLQRLAAACVSGGGLAGAADVGSPGEMQALLDTRLVVRRGDRHLAFALPVIEQYFAGQALLANGVLAEVVRSVELLDRWRYGLAMAIASGGWKSTRMVLDPLLRAHPGVAAWAAHEAVPQAEREQESSWPDLPDDVVCQRLQTALEAWQQALSPAGERIFLYTGWSGPVTVDAGLTGNELWLHILRRDGDHTPGLAVPATQRWTEPRGVRPLEGSFGPVAADYAAWPWRTTLDLLASHLNTLCERRDFDLADCDAYTKERLWSAGADLMGLASRRFTPLRAEEVHQKLRQHLYDRGSLPVRSGFGHRFTGRQAELLRLEEELGSGRWADGHGLLHSPYAVPDQARGPHTHWVWDSYSPEQLRLRTEQVLTAAVEIYTALVETWFPQLKQALGLASVAPAALVADLYQPPSSGSGSYEPPRMRLSLRPSPTNSVTVRLVPSENDIYSPLPSPPPGKQPARSPWARPSTPVVSEPEVFDDAPATNYAYAWLHEDLHRLHLTDRAPRITSTSLP